MEFVLMCIGKTGKSFLEAGEKEYLTRLKHYLPTRLETLPDVKQTKQTSEAFIKEQEGKQFLAKIGANETVILLDDKGEQRDSVQFAHYLQQLMNRGGKTVYFLVGGPYGFSDEIYRRANGKISLSKLTFSHQMIRMLFLEQVYRGMTILKGEPYHHQ